MLNYVLMPAALAGRSNLPFGRLYTVLDANPEKRYSLSSGVLFNLEGWQGACLRLFPGPREASATERAFMELEIRQTGERLFLSEVEGAEPGKPGKFELAINKLRFSTEFFEGGQQRFWTEVHAEVLRLQAIEQAWAWQILAAVSRSPLIDRPSLSAELRQALAA